MGDNWISKMAQEVRGVHRLGLRQAKDSSNRLLL